MRPRLLALAELRPDVVARQLETDYQVVRDLDTASDVEVVLTSGRVGLSAAQMAKLPRLKLVAVNGVGLDAVDLDYARRHAITITTTPDVLSPFVAELAVALALAVTRRVVQGDAFIRAGQWSKTTALPLGNSLVGRKAGILGYGRIGRAVAQLLSGFGMEILYTTRTQPAGTPDAGYRPDLLTLAQDCDILFATVAGGEATRGLINAAVLAALGPGGVVINVARGSVVDSAALAQALHAGTIAGAGLDVFDNEPEIPPSLRDAPNCVLTPHIASATTAARFAMAALVTNNIAAHFAGQPLQHVYEG